MLALLLLRAFVAHWREINDTWQAIPWLRSHRLKQACSSISEMTCFHIKKQKKQKKQSKVKTINDTENIC
jgi:hypothetical protein